jgi:hypothetical protein
LSSSLVEQVSSLESDRESFTLLSCKQGGGRWRL